MRGKELPAKIIPISEEQLRCLELAAQELREGQICQERAVDMMASRRRINNLPFTGSTQIIRESIVYIGFAQDFFNRSAQSLREIGKMRMQPVSSKYSVRWGGNLDSFRCDFSDCFGDSINADSKELLSVPGTIGRAFLRTLFSSDYPEGGWVESHCDLHKCLDYLRAGRTISLTFQSIEYYI